MKLRALFERAYTLERDDGEVNEDALDKLFTKQVSATMDDINKWDEAGLSVIDLDDQMGSDTIFNVKGTFILWDRHAGETHAAPKGSTAESILDAIRIEKDIGPQ